MADPDFDQDAADDFDGGFTTEVFSGDVTGDGDAGGDFDGDAGGDFDGDAGGDFNGDAAGAFADFDGDGAAASAEGGKFAAPAPSGEPETKGGEEEVDLRMEWRREYNERLEAKRTAAREAIQARKAAAAEALANYLTAKETAREAKLSAGRTSEQTVYTRLDEVASGNTWDRVLSLINYKADDPEVNVKDVTRFKNVLLRLKNEPRAAADDA